MKHCQLILLMAFNSLPSGLTIKQLNGELQEVFQLLVCTANMNMVPGMDIINKFADSLGMPVVNLNIYRRKALDNIDLNLVSHRYVSGVLKDDHFVSACSRAPRF